MVRWTPPASLPVRIVIVFLDNQYLCGWSLRDDWLGWWLGLRFDYGYFDRIAQVRFCNHDFLASGLGGWSLNTTFPSASIDL
jgi:hypothetical protein